MAQISRGMQIVFSDPAHRRLRAFHECGHAAWLFLDGRMFDIVGISIAPRRFGDGPDDVDTGICEYLGQPYTREWVKEGGDRKTQLTRAARAIAMNFAGPVCEYRAEGCETADLWDTVLDNDWWGHRGSAVCFEDNPDLLSTDFGSALATAYQVYPTHRKRLDQIGAEAYDYLHRVFKWTNELFSVNEVWCLVESLSAEFEESTVQRIGGNQARDVLRREWAGDPHGVPLHAFGTKWHRRFTRVEVDSLP